MTAPALFIAAHPDDEILAMGVALAEHLAASPGQDIHVLWLSRGMASGTIDALNGDVVSPWWGVRHDPDREGYDVLTTGDLGAARIAEARAAVRCLAARQPGALTLHEAGLPDGQMTVEMVADAVQAVCDEIAPGAPVRLKGHSQIVDNHPDHLAAGAALTAMAAQDPARYSDVRHYVLPYLWTDPRLSQVVESWDTPANADIRQRVINASRAYAAWAPPGRYAIGHHSTPSYFAAIESAPKCMVHA